MPRVALVGGLIRAVLQRRQAYNRLRRPGDRGCGYKSDGNSPVPLQRILDSWNGRRTSRHVYNEARQLLPNAFKGIGNVFQCLQLALIRAI
jgi:hypothetical protein